MGLILKTGAILSGNVALTSDGVEEVRPPQWDNPVVVGSMSGIYGTASKLVIDGTEVTGGTILFNEPSSENTSIWANDVVVGSMSGVYGSTSRLVLDGTEVTGGQVLYGFDRPDDSIWANDVVVGSMSGIYGTASKLVLDGTEVTGGTLLFNEPDSPNTSIWSNDVVVGSMSGIYGTASKLVIDGTEVTGGQILYGFDRTGDSIWANPVVTGSLSGIYSSTSKLLLDGTEVTGGTILDGFSEPDDSVWANPVVVGSLSGVYGSTSQLIISLVNDVPTDDLLVGPGVTYSGGSPFGTGHEGQTQWGPGPSAAFDTSPSTEFHTIASGTRNLGYDFGQLQHVSSYKMHARPSGRPHILTGWDVLASDDGINWRTIAQERNVSWPNRFISTASYNADLSNTPWKEFTISDPSSNNMFRYLRLDFVSTNDGWGYMVVPGLAFYGNRYNNQNNLSNVTEFAFSGDLESTESISSGDILTIDPNLFNGSYDSTSFTVDKTTTMEMYLWGAGGGGTKRSADRTGGMGGYSSGTYTFEPNIEYHVVVGGGGEGGYQDPANNDAFGAYSTGGGRPESNTTSIYDGVGGGGYTGVFSGSVSLGSALIIAGGGGGGSGDTAMGGNGGGDSGASGSNGGRVGAGGTQLAGGGGAGNAGSALQGGNGVGVGAGGGGGYYGGGGGGNSGPGAGGGGSGYISTELTGASTSAWTTNSYHKNDAGLGGSNGRQGKSGLLIFRKVS